MSRRAWGLEIPRSPNVPPNVQLNKTHWYLCESAPAWLACAIGRHGSFSVSTGQNRIHLVGLHKTSTVAS